MIKMMYRHKLVYLALLLLVFASCSEKKSQMEVDTSSVETTDVVIDQVDDVSNETNITDDQFTLIDTISTQLGTSSKIVIMTNPEVDGQKILWSDNQQWRVRYIGMNNVDNIIYDNPIQLGKLVVYYNDTSVYLVEEAPYVSGKYKVRADQLIQVEKVPNHLKKLDLAEN